VVLTAACGGGAADGQLGGAAGGAAGEGQSRRPPLRRRSGGQARIAHDLRPLAPPAGATELTVGGPAPAAAVNTTSAEVARALRMIESSLTVLPGRGNGVSRPRRSPQQAVVRLAPPLRVGETESGIW